MVKFCDVFWLRFRWHNDHDVIPDFLKFNFVVISLKKQNLATHVKGHQNRRLRGAGGGEYAGLGDFWKFVTKTMHFRHISAKIQPKNLKQHFDWGRGDEAPGYALAFSARLQLCFITIILHNWCQWVTEFFKDDCVILSLVPNQKYFFIDELWRERNYWISN